MSLRPPNSGCSPSRNEKIGFSLIELLTVMGFISLLLVLTVPAISGLKGSGDFTRAVDEMTLALAQAKAYAVAKNTFVWVGFYEESDDGNASSSLPPFPGKGQVVMATVASVDGTRIVEDSADPATLPANKLRPISPILKIKHIHLMDIGAPVGGDSYRIDGRPDIPYTSSGGESSRISSETALKTPYPFQVEAYTFYKTIRFSPSGEITINGAAIPKRIGEIGLVPFYGDQTSSASINAAAVQFSGMGGNIRAYRR